MNNKFFLYARKSTDVEDKQIRSIEAQITELRAFAKQNNLDMVEEFIEKQSAKIPGRPIFGEMIKRIEKGEADGILAWHPDRLARNSVDGGQIIYLLYFGRIFSPKFPPFFFLFFNWKKKILKTERYFDPPLGRARSPRKPHFAV